MNDAQTTLYTKCREALRTGYHWCLGCRAITELKNPGEPHQCCSLCESHRVVWNPPLLNSTSDNFLSVETTE